MALTGHDLRRGTRGRWQTRQGVRMDPGRALTTGVLESAVAIGLLYNWEAIVGDIDEAPGA